MTDTMLCQVKYPNVYGRIFASEVKSLTWISILLPGPPSFFGKSMQKKSKVDFIFQGGPPNKGSVARLMPITTSYVNGKGSCATLTHLSTT